MKHFRKARENHDYTDYQSDNYNGKRDRENNREVGAYGNRHGKRHNKHYGSADENADYHHIGHLNIADVRRKTRNEACGVEVVEVCETEILNLVVNALSDVHGEARRGICRVSARQNAEKQG